jgi:Zn-dependent peptidase ImmA (M78 family)/DNA-binding XRE family transcriptional regulator
MSNRVRAKVKAALLIWARESAGLTQADAASKADVKLEALASWESEESAAGPSIPQLRKLAAIYKRPLAVFYLQEPPTKFMALKDFRRMPGGGLPAMPSAVVLDSRLARERREAALEMMEDAEIEIRDFNFQASITDDPSKVADQIRERLDIKLPLAPEHKDGTGHKALKYWRNAIEALDVLVLQTDRFPADVVSGYAIYERKLPIIVVSRKNASPRKRLFSLLHEFTHLLLRASGISDSSIDGEISKGPEEQRVEVFCNAVAAATLLPAEGFLSHHLVAQHAGQEWTDSELSLIGRDYGVSREVVLRRLLSFGRTSKTFYEAARDRFKNEWLEKKARERLERSEGIPRNMANEVFSDLGRRIVWLVLDRFHHETLTLSDVSGLLGIKTKHIPALEQMSRRSQ